MQNLDRNRVRRFVIGKILARREGKENQVRAVDAEHALDRWAWARGVRSRGFVEQVQSSERGTVVSRGAERGGIIDGKVSHTFPR